MDKRMTMVLAAAMFAFTGVMGQTARKIHLANSSDN
jgi:hypothetical protein